jgi:hypothetical protein
MNRMAIDKHISPPATAREIRGMLGITETDRTAASQLLDLTAGPHAVVRRAGQAKTAGKTVAARPSTKARPSKRGAKTAAAGKNRTPAKKAAPKLPAAD